MIDAKMMADPLLYIPANFKVIDKEGQLIPMKLYPVQEWYIKHRSHKDIILKGRQMRMSTGVLAANSHKLFTMPYQTHSIITHDSETSEYLFQVEQRFYRKLPWNEGKADDQMQPMHDWKSGTRMRFPNIDSYIYIDSAKSDSIGIGHKLDVVRASEVARWPSEKADRLWADLTHTVPMSGWITAESTPRGRVGLFFELYQAAKRKEIDYQPFFFPWWWEPEYRIKIEAPLKLTKEEQMLIDVFKLDQEQIAFRRMKQAELRELFYQEYPESDTQCWLANDIGVVDPLTLQPYFLNIRDGATEGNITTWKGPIGGRRYVMGVDVAAGYATGDYSVAAVIDVRTMEYVARIRGRIAPDLFAEMVCQLGKKYNNALIAVEKIHHGHTVLKVLLQKDYPNIYYYMEYDDFQKINITEPGWKTSVRTKPMMVNDLVAAFRAQDLISWSSNLLDEASSLVWDGDKKVKKGSSKVWDDEWDAVSIALQIREQTPRMGEERAKITYYA